MTSYVALLRGVNLRGGTTLRMADLKSIAEGLGLESARTFIASGNLLFASNKSEAAIKSELQAAVGKHMSREVRAMVRTADEMAAVAKPTLNVVQYLWERVYPRKGRYRR